MKFNLLKIARQLYSAYYNNQLDYKSKENFEKYVLNQIGEC